MADKEILKCMVEVAEKEGMQMPPLGDLRLLLGPRTVRGRMMGVDSEIAQISNGDKNILTINREAFPDGRVIVDQIEHQGPNGSRASVMGADRREYHGASIESIVNGQTGGSGAVPSGRITPTVDAIIRCITKPMS